MILNTHLRIGGFVYKHVISKSVPYSTKGKLSFQLGNIYPDINPALKEIKHYKETSLIPMLEHEKKVMDTCSDPNERLKSLGIICHYLTDFFCIYHSVSKYRKKSIVKHILYEIGIDVALFFVLLSPSRVLKKLRLPDIEKSFAYADSFPGEKFSYGKTFDVRDLYLSLQKQYNRKKHGILNDIFFSLKVTSLTVSVILKDYAIYYPEVGKTATGVV